MHNAPTLSNYTADQSQIAQIFHCHMCNIRPRFVQIGPSQKTPRPITLTGFMVGDESANSGVSMAPSRPKRLHARHVWE